MITNKKIVRLSVAVFLIFIFIPLIFFVVKFMNVSLSSNIEDWGSFGDFFGGILNPIIALIGTIILGYLTYMVSQQSTQENKKLFLFEQRVLAFQKIARLNLEIEEGIYKGMLKISHINNLILLKKTNDALEKQSISDEFIHSLFSKLYIELKHFPTINSHLFEYNFNSNEYLTLIELSKKFYFSTSNALKSNNEKNNVDIDGDLGEKL